MKNLKIAILYQVNKPPLINGVSKPMKPGGYSDSGADIAFALKEAGILVITPVEVPDLHKDLEWVFPDTKEGINQAINKGAEILWLNTVLYKGHPIENFFKKKVAVVGQIPKNVDKYDNKIVTNILLKNHGIPVPESVIVTEENKKDFKVDFSFPVIMKPIRGRGSQGVIKIDNYNELNEKLDQELKSGNSGNSFYVERYLSGEELTLTIMPPGKYKLKGDTKIISHYWSLPPVRRFNHINGIAPYNGTVAVVNNSEVLNRQEINTEKIQTLCAQCEIASKLVGAKAPIRIDCRADEKGNYYLFDLNMKPNMTGASRPNRKDQDSLSSIAAKNIGWSYTDLLINMLHQHWN